MGPAMKYEASVHRRFESGDVSFVYSASSAAVLALDETSDAVLARFAVPGGADLETWDTGDSDAGEEQQRAFEELVETRASVASDRDDGDRRSVRRRRGANVEHRGSICFVEYRVVLHAIRADVLDRVVFAAGSDAVQLFGAVDVEAHGVYLRIGQHTAGAEFEND